jgi:APA family basic amino acid/polyamine antiporter
MISIITVISANNATLLTAPRVLYGMARDRLLPGRLTAVNRGGTPAWALFLCMIVSITLILSGTFETLIAIGSVILAVIYVFVFASLLALRRREPDLPRPCKAWWYPWSAVCALVVSLGFLLGAVIGDLRHSLFTVVLVAGSYLVSCAIVRARGAASASSGRPAPPAQ